MIKIISQSTVILVLMSYSSILLGQANAQLPIITGNISELLSKTTLSEGENPLGVTPLGSKIIAKVRQGKVVNYIVKDINGKILLLMLNTQVNKPGTSTKCPTGSEKNCGCIPSNCFCEPTNSKNIN